MLQKAWLLIINGLSYSKETLPDCSQLEHAELQQIKTQDCFRNYNIVNCGVKKEGEFAHSWF